MNASVKFSIRFDADIVEAEVILVSHPLARIDMLVT